MSATTEKPSLAVAPRPGAYVEPEGVRYAVWAPDHAEMAVEVRRPDGRNATVRLAPTHDGYFAGLDPAGRAGDRYAYRLPDGALLPDPVSRFQPDGVHAASQCVDPAAYRWQCGSWRRPGWTGQSIYELHVGAFTPEGTFAAARQRLEHVASLGVQAVELMPLADFPGQRNWGYDGVALYAPARCYGTPDDLRRLVDAAHELGLAMVLDVVYNHLGPDGNHLAQFAGAYFHPDRHTPWGQALNLSGPGSAPVREYFLGNMAYWLDEFRFDGLRLDATHALDDDDAQSFLTAVAVTAHDRGAFVIAEDERNTCGILRREDGTGAGLDAAWADDFHHSLRVALTGVQQAYFRNYRGSAAELARTIEQGWLFTGPAGPAWEGRVRGEPCGHLPPRAFIHCLENHDQVGNRALGERLEHLIGPAAFRAASAFLCLSPYPPLLFMGQEWAAGTPFLFFTDHGGDLGRLVSEGRRNEFSGLHDVLAPGDVPDPQDEDTFLRSKLAWDELRLCPHATVLELYRECLRQRAEWLTGQATARERWRVESIGNVVALRYAGLDGTDRLLLISLHGDARVPLATKPLLRAPDGTAWELALDSNATGPDFTSLSPTTSIVWTGAEHRTMETVVFDAPGTVLLVARRPALAA